MDGNGFVDRLADLAWRVAFNPNPWHAPQRMAQRFLQAFYKAGLYHLPQEPIYRGYEGRFNLHLLPDEFSTRRIWFRGYVQYEEAAFIRQLLRSGMTVVDAGANIGWVSLLCAKCVSPGGQVHSFEPVSNTFRVLEKNAVSNNLQNIIHVNHMALSDQDGEITMSWQAKRSNLSHITNAASGGDSPSATSHVSGAQTTGTEQVRSIRLDQYVQEKQISKVDFLKIDVEGAELLLLAGAEQMIDRDHPVVMSEFNELALRRFGRSIADLLDWWKKRGYSFASYCYRSKTLREYRHTPDTESVTLVGSTNLVDLGARIGARVV